MRVAPIGLQSQKTIQQTKTELLYLNSKPFFVRLGESCHGRHLQNTTIFISICKEYF